VCALAAPPLRAETITVSAAISMKEAVEDLARAYEKDAPDKVELNFGSSGQLMTQVARGAPVDVFISAADEQMDQLERDGLVDPQTRLVVAGNRLVLIVPGHPTGAGVSFPSLSDQRFKRIGIGHPDSVPAGAYAMQVLTRIGLAEAVRDRLVYGANVRQVLSYVERGEVEAGIVYRTDVLAGATVSVVATADESWHAAIRYPAAVVRASKKPESARRFLAFLRTGPAREILSRHGFTPLPPATQPAR
jgi:molybdate transport system substrate-binding protein